MSDGNEWIVIAVSGGDGAVNIVAEAEVMLTGLEYIVKRREADLYQVNHPKQANSAYGD